MTRHLPRIRLAALALMVRSWVVFADQAFFEFEGALTWRHHCTHLEYYNHPLRLPTLRRVEWRNTCSR